MTNASQAYVRLNELIEQINYHNHLYYQQDKNEITDEEYDKLIQELIALENEFPHLKDVNSPSQRVGGTITKKFVTVQHHQPMLSLDNIYSIEELRNFDNRVAKGLGSNDYEYVCEIKFDGVSISLHYEKGMLSNAVTRGDGAKGDDVTNNIKTIRDIPLKIDGGDYPSTFEVRGEVFLRKNVFQALNEQCIKEGKEMYSNARNTASGTIKMQDSRIVASRKLNFYAYQLLGKDISVTTHKEAFPYLSRWGFCISPTYALCHSIDEVSIYIKKWERERNNLPVETDGVVIKINDYAQRVVLGHTSKSPRWAVAYKYKAEKANTRLLSIDYQVGRTGAITPVAKLSPVSLSGSTVKRASLHNANEIERLELRKNDYVWIEKGGDIIPKVVSVDITKRKKNSLAERYKYISHCPDCNHLLICENKGAIHYCPNIEGCPTQIRARLEHFVGRKAMDIRSLGEKTIAQLCEKGLVRTPSDLYRLNQHDIAMMEGFKEQSTQNLLQGLEESKKVPFERVLFALGIRHVGKTTAYQLVHLFQNVDHLSLASLEELTEKPEIGKKIAESILSFFNKHDNKIEVERLKKIGLQFAVDQKRTDLRISDALAGQSFLISGVMQNYSREDLQTIIVANGGKILSAVSKKLDYLIAGENMGISKKEKAERLDVKIISENDLKQMLN